MKAFTRIGILAGLIALMFLISPGVTRAQNDRGCAWPIELSPEGFGNATMPENLARYFIMPFDAQYDTMTIKGMYPSARYFSFAAYDTVAGTPAAIPGGRTLYDVQIAPDPGSINPFVQPGGSNGKYTVVISRGSQSVGNTIVVGQDKFKSDFVWVLLRIYIPSADPSPSGQSLTGGVPLPTIFLDGAELLPCSPVNKLPDLRALIQKLFPVDLQGGEGTPPSDRLWFAPSKFPPMSLLPNPDNKYVGMLPGDDYEPGRIIVIHGKAPAIPADMRYWSVCEGNLALPVTAVSCTSDLTTNLQGGDYTIVISDDLLRPDWLRPNINWLPWGDENYPKVVFFRNMLPKPNFPFAIQNAIEHGCNFDFGLPNIPHSNDPKLEEAGQCAQKYMGDYYPVAVWSDKSTFVAGGFRACLKE